VTEFLVALAASVVVMAVAEYVAHYGGPCTTRRSAGSSGCRGENHAVLHHGRYYRESFVNDPDPASRVISVRMSVAEHLAGALAVALPLWWLGLPVAAATFLAVVALHAVTWTTMHVEMHTPRGRWFCRTRYYRYVRDLHHAHHLHPGKNFCAVFPPVMDKLMGTYHPPVEAPEGEFCEVERLKRLFFWQAFWVTLGPALAAAAVILWRGFGG
jgi:hypothetical protein